MQVLQLWGFKRGELGEESISLSARIALVDVIVNMNLIVTIPVTVIACTRFLSSRYVFLKKEEEEEGDHDLSPELHAKKSYQEIGIHIARAAAAAAAADILTYGSLTHSSLISSSSGHPALPMLQKPNKWMSK